MEIKTITDYEIISDIEIYYMSDVTAYPSKNILSLKDNVDVLVEVITKTTTQGKSLIEYLLLDEIEVIELEIEKLEKKSIYSLEEIKEKNIEHRVYGHYDCIYGIHFFKVKKDFISNPHLKNIMKNFKEIFYSIKCLFGYKSK